MKHDLQKTVDITNKLFNLFYDKYFSDPYSLKLKIYFDNGDLVYNTYNGQKQRTIDITKVPNNTVDAIIYFFDNYFCYYCSCLTISHFLALFDNDIYYEKGHLFDKKLQIMTIIKGNYWGWDSDGGYSKRFNRHTKQTFIQLLLEKYV